MVVQTSGSISRFQFIRGEGTSSHLKSVNIHTPRAHFQPECSIPGTRSSLMPGIRHRVETHKSGPVSGRSSIWSTEADIPPTLNIAQPWVRCEDQISLCANSAQVHMMKNISAAYLASRLSKCPLTE